MPDINTGDTAWLLMSSALVLLMTPGLAFFYGGMVRAKSVLNMMMMSFIAIGIVSILWVLFGYSVAFGDTGNGFWGGLGQIGLGELIGQTASNGGYYPIPALVFAMFQLMFAIITVALISGAVADRTKFLGLGHLRRHLGLDRLLPGRALGVRLRQHRARRRRRRLARQPRRPGLRRRNGGPHQRRCRRPGPGDRPGQARGLAQDPDEAAQPAPGAARLRPAVLRLVRVQRRLGPGRQPDGSHRVHQHHARDGSRDHRLVDHGEDPRRPPHLARCRVGRRGRPGGDHPGLCVHRALRRHRPGPGRRRPLCAGGGTEVPLPHR